MCLMSNCDFIFSYLRLFVKSVKGSLTVEPVLHDWAENLVEENAITDGSCMQANPGFYAMPTKQVDYNPQKMISDIRRSRIYL